MSTPFSERAKMPHAEGTWPATWAKSSQVEPCCDLHGRNCEPPSELCCGECTEASHDAVGFMTGTHQDGSPCSSTNLSPMTLSEVERREAIDGVSRIRAHLEYLLGVADIATRPPWKVASLTGVVADNGIDQGLVAATWSSLGVPASRNTVFIAASRTAVPELATVVLAVLDWLEETAGDQEPVRAASVAEEGLNLLQARIASPVPPPDLRRELVAIAARVRAERDEHWQQRLADLQAEIALIQESHERRVARVRAEERQRIEAVLAEVKREAAEDRLESGADWSAYDEQARGIEHVLGALAAGSAVPVATPEHDAGCERTYGQTGCFCRRRADVAFSHTAGPVATPTEPVAGRCCQAGRESYPDPCIWHQAPAEQDGQR